MADSITTFSADASRQIAQAVRDFQRRPMHPAQLDTDWAGGEAREIRWGRTTTSLEYPSYPSSGGVYVCELGDYTHSGIPSVTPTKTFTAYSPKSTVVAVDPTGATWAQNTVVRLERHEGEWWIRPAAGSGWKTCYLYKYKRYLESGIGTPSSNQISAARGGAFFFQRALGDVDGCGVSVLTSSASAYTDVAFKITTAGLYAFYLVGRALDETSYVAGDYYFTQTTSSSGGHTHTVNVPDYGQISWGWWRLLKRASGGAEGDFAIACDGFTDEYRYGGFDDGATHSTWALAANNGKSSTGCMEAHAFRVLNVNANDEFSVRGKVYSQTAIEDVYDKSVIRWTIKDGADSIDHAVGLWITRIGDQTSELTY